MKLSKLISILAAHMDEQGDREVVISVGNEVKAGDYPIGHCWFDFDHETVPGNGKVHISE